MARSKPRKSAQVKIRQERTQKHQEHRQIDLETTLMHRIIHGILRDCPPVHREEPMTREEIDLWFDTDPAAPVILMSRPPGDPFPGEAKLQIAFSVNQWGVERELRARGIDEHHPSWRLAQHVVGPTLMDLAKELLAEAATKLPRRWEEVTQEQP